MTELGGETERDEDSEYEGGGAGGRDNERAR